MYEYRFNVDVMKLYISALGHDRKLKFSLFYVYLLSINQISSRSSDSVQCRRGLHF